MIDDLDLLDYCILAYQLHSQTLVFAIDPYGEQMRSVGSQGSRRRFLDQLDHELRNDEQRGNLAKLYPGCRGNDMA